MKQNALHSYALPGSKPVIATLYGLRWAFFAFLITITSNCFSQTTLLNETFGTGTLFPLGWTPSSTNDWSAVTTNPSTGYTGASAGTNAFFTPTGNLPKTLTYNNTLTPLSTVGYTNITIMWGGRYVSLSTTNYTINVVLSWSADGTTWNDVTYTNVPVSSTGVWGLVNGGTRIALPAGAAGIANLRLRFTATASNVNATSANTVYRVDDVTVSGCPLTGSISYTGSPFCKSITAAQSATAPSVAGGTYSSTAGLSINASTGAITPSTSTAGTYTVTYTLACGSSTTTTVVISDLPTVGGTSTETCVGGSTGTITASATGGVSPYTYSLNSGAYQSSTSFTGLAAATYTLNAKTSIGCIASTSVTVSRFANSPDAQTITATDSWVGHMYDATTFTDYIGRFTETENFNELFGGSTTCFSLASSTGTRSIYTESMSAKMLMNSTKKGLYTVNLGADDASRLSVDGTLIYNNWTSGTYSLKSNVLMGLAGSSNLLYEYYENTGANQLAFQGLTLLLANNLATNTAQTICIGNGTGLAISGDAFGTLPVGVTAVGTGYQWSYSTTPGGARTNITGATLATYTPLTTLAPFNAVGTYYVYRTASLSSVNNTGFVTYSTSIESNAATITIVSDPTATISYAGNPFCTSTAPGAVTRVGSAGGTFSAGAGLSIDASTGTITPGSSTPGTYTVTYSIAGTLLCASFTTTTSVTITAPPTATISYAGTPYCSSITAAQAVNRTGTSGGTYSSTTGLSINSTTGEIAPGASTAGAYTVTYTIAAAGGCAAFSTTAAVTITAAANATISYAGSPFCKSLTAAQAVTLTGTTGGTFSSTAGLSINSTTGAVTPSTSTTGTYTITYSIAAAGGCAAFSTTSSVVISDLPTISGTSTETCVGGSTGTITINATGGASPYTYSLNSGSYQSATTFTGLAAATNTINAKTSAGCVASASVTVSPYANSGDDQNITATNSWVGHAYHSTNFTNYIGRFTETENFNELFGGAYNCFNLNANVGIRSILTEYFSVKFRMTSTKKGLYVADLGADDGSQLTVDGTLVYNNYTNQVFTNKPSVLMNLTGSSSLLLEYYELAGDNQVAFQNLTLVLANTLSTNTTQSICSGNTGLPISGDVYGTLPAGITASGTGYQWSYSTTPAGARTNIPGATSATFTPSGAAAPFNTVGTYYLYRNATLSSNNNVSPNPYATSNESNAATVQVLAVISGNTVDYTNGVHGVICTATGEYNTATITAPAGCVFTTVGFASYGTPAGSCPSFAYGNCHAAGSQTIAEDYLLGNNTGSIPVENAVFGDPCNSIVKTFALQATYTQPICSGTSPGTITGTTPAGGTGTYTYLWEKSTTSSSTGFTAATGTNNTINYTPGTLTQTTWYRRTVTSGNCSDVSKVLQVTVTPTPTATISYAGAPFCNSLTVAQAVTRTGTSGGTYSSTTGLSINAATGDITPNTSSAGTYTITYTVAAAGGCAVFTTTTSVTITAAPTATISYAGTPFCKSLTAAQPVTLSGNNGGAFSATTGLSINTGTGAITPNTSIAGTYTVTYTIAAAGGCAAFSTTTTVTITTAPAATISYAGSPFCKSTATAQAITRSGTSGGTYSSTTGLSINTTTGDITPNTSTAGTYTVTYTIAASGGCAVFSTTTSVTITTAPSATISYSGTPFCTSITAAQAVSRSGTGGGTYSSTTGLSINTTTGDITPNTSTAGTYTITYTIAASGGCSAFSTTSSVTITALPAATISYAGNPYCSDASTATVTISGNNGGSFNSTSGLSINGTTGAVNIATSTIGNYTVTYTIPASGGCSAVSATTPFTIKTAGIWTGATNNDFGTGSNWLCGSIPLVTTNIVIPAGLSVYPIITGTNTVNNVSIASGASLTVKGIFQITGTITNNGKFSATTGTVEFDGSTAQQIPVGLFDSALVKNLTINNIAGVTLSDSLKLTGILKITAGQFNTGDKLVLKSTAIGTAMVAAITSAAATPINGKVTVERYVPGRRKYRLMTSPVTTSTATTLAPGQESLSIWGAWQNSGNNTTGNTGTFITGGSSADGFDPQTTNASLFTYDDVNRRYLGFTTANGKKTKYTPLKAGVAYYMFVYGDRVNTIITSTPNPTVLRSVGTLLTGDQVYTTASAIPLSSVVGRFTLLGNPFASAINWATIPKTNLDNAYWGWDPNLSNTGGYVTVLTSGTVTLQAPYTGSTGLNQYIQPGQGFFVKTTAATPTLTIREQDKVTNFNANAFRTGGIDNMSLLAVNLLYNNGSTRVLADGVLAAFDNSTLPGEGSATKLVNNNENIALLKDTNWLSIDTRPLPRNNDTVLLNLWRLTKPQYTLQIFAQQLAATGRQAYLYDKYLDTLQLLSLTDTNAIVFDVTPGVAASSDTNRFRIVFRSGNTPLPLTFTSIKASAIGKNVAIDWLVANETGIQQYQVEKATNGIAFIQAGIINSRGNAGITNYRWIDTNPAVGNNYYRIKAIQKDGQFFLSKTALFQTASGNFSITIFPNPVTENQLTFRCAELKKGSYKIAVVDVLGHTIMTKETNHNGGLLTETLYFKKALSKGMYYLNITNNNLKNQQSFFVQ